MCYENESGMRATRAAWSLEYMGHRRARILDGGLKARGRELTTDVEPVAPSAISAAPREEIFASRRIRRRAARPRARCKFSTCAATRNISANACARNTAARFPARSIRIGAHNVAADGAFKSPAELRAAVRALGLAPDAEIVPYCQGGYRAAHAYFALKLAGYQRVRNYSGRGPNGAIATTCRSSIRGANETRAAPAGAPRSEAGASAEYCC